VTFTVAGVYAYAARAALVADHVARTAPAFPDAAVEGAFFAALQRPPAIVLERDDPDFTPFWQRPLRASYVAAADAGHTASDEDATCANVAGTADRIP
jgi:hypothetical protein